MTIVPPQRDHRSCSQSVVVVVVVVATTNNNNDDDDDDDDDDDGGSGGGSGRWQVVGACQAGVSRQTTNHQTATHKHWE